MSGSQIWIDASCCRFERRRADLDNHLVLELDLDLSNSTLRCQIVNPDPVPSHLSPDDVSEFEYWPHHFRLPLVLLDAVQRYLCMHACRLFLESGSRFKCKWEMLEPPGAVVTQSETPYILFLVADQYQGSVTLH